MNNFSMKENITGSDTELLHFMPLVFSPQEKYPIVILGVILYMISVAFNLTLVLLIIKDKTLHRPMFLILLNQQLNDLLGSAAMIPKVLHDMLTDTDTVQYHICFLQGFLLHLYGATNLIILAVLAIDRYIAICNPLRYSTIMSPDTVAAAIATIWFTPLVIILSVFLMTAHLPRCNNSLRYVFCDNQSLLQLSCADKTANNIYGLFTFLLLQIITIKLQLVSYINILWVCLKSRKSETWSKAIHTCVAQICVAFIFQVMSITNILSHRLHYLSINLQNVNAMLICIIPPFFNPVIYGLKLKEIRSAIHRACADLLRCH